MVQMHWSGQPPKSPEPPKVAVQSSTLVAVAVSKPVPVKLEVQKDDRE